MISYLAWLGIILLTVIVLGIIAMIVLGVVQTYKRD